MRCFSSPGLPSIPYVFRNGYHPIKDGGFPHSEISGSKRTYSSPKHIGVRPVLLRLLVPRHPPCALSSLTFDLLGIAAITHQLLLSSCIKIIIGCRCLCYLVFKEQGSYLNPLLCCLAPRKPTSLALLEDAGAYLFHHISHILKEYNHSFKTKRNAHVRLVT